MLCNVSLYIIVAEHSYLSSKEIYSIRDTEKEGVK